jgi:hypothetical protein
LTLGFTAICFIIVLHLINKILDVAGLVVFMLANLLSWRVKMRISVDVHNYMETLVGQVLAQEKFIAVYDNEQLADLACLALNQLRPVYIRYDVDFLSALPEKRLVAFKQNAIDAVTVAESMIVDDRRKNRDEGASILMPTVSFDESAENKLEWFETPLMPKRKK